VNTVFPDMTEVVNPREAFRQSLRTAITNATPHAVDQLVREDAPKHDERELLAKDRALLEAVIEADDGDANGGAMFERYGDRNLYDGERDAFPDMLDRVKQGRLLTQKQRNWVYSTADRLGVETKPVRAKDVPRGREVELAPALSHRPLAPPGKKPPVGSSIEEQVAFGFGVRRGYGANAELPFEDPCDCGGKGLGVGLRPAPVVPPPEPAPAWLPLLARLLGLPETKVSDAYVQAVELAKSPVTLASGEVVYRTPDGHIDNCSLADGEPEERCQVCKGQCPDRGRRRVPTVVNALRTGRLDVPMPFDDLPDFDARSGEEDDVPF
jgi:hypothetical protein